MNSRGNQRIRAGRRAALMRVRFEVDIKRSSAGLATGPFQGENFCVLYAIVSVDACACDLALPVHDDRSHMGIGRGEADALTGKVESLVQELLVSGVCGHSGESNT